MLSTDLLTEKPENDFGPQNYVFMVDDMLEILSFL